MSSNGYFGSSIIRQFAPLFCLPLFDVTLSRKYSLYDATVEEWTSILKLAHQWEFNEVKELAVRGLESLPIPALQKVVLYQTYHVNRTLLQPAYTALIVRDEPITIEEGREVELETALQLARAREIARAPSFSSRRVGNPRSPVNLAGDELHALIDDVFRLSPSGATSEHTTQRPAGSGNARDTSQTASTQSQTNGSSVSNPPQGMPTMCTSLVEHTLIADIGTGTNVNGTTNGTTNGQSNGHINGTPNTTTGTRGQVNGRRS